MMGETEQVSVKDPSSSEYLVFSLGEEEYAIDILKVQEIRGHEKVTRIANCPEFILGVTNLRGVIVPIVDLRIKFLGDAKYDEQTVVIVANVKNRVVGIVVDAVSDVMTLKPEEIKPAPDFTAIMSTDYLSGLVSLKERMLILLDIENLLSSEEMALL